MIRQLYYFIVNRLSDIPLVKNVTGFGIYDARVMEDIRKIDDPYPYFRGLICDLGYEQYFDSFQKSPSESVVSLRTTFIRFTTLRF